MIFSRTSEYAIRALGFLAKNANDRAIGSGEVSKRTGIPAAYVAKIFQGLAQAGILVSERGSKGGYRFQIAPLSLTLHDVLKVTEGFPGPTLAGCVMGFKNCSDKHPCALHPVWALSREKILKAMKETSILAAAKSMHKKTFGREKRGVLSKPLLSILKPV